MHQGSGLTPSAFCAAYGAPPEIAETIAREGLLPPILLTRLARSFPDRVRFSASPALFSDKARYSGIAGFREVCQRLAAEGVTIEAQAERELFIDVYRFLATRHTLNSIDWTDFQNDSLFHLVFPQPGMFEPDVVAAYTAASSREDRQKIAADYIQRTNPHDGNQQLNKPWFYDENDELHVLPGSQHKYPQIQLIFDRSTQHCFSFCTYCFRHAQVRGDEDMFVQEDIGQVHAYLRAHREVTDLLLTGGDAGLLTADRFEAYVTPLIEDPALAHVRTVRIGSRALTYLPELVLGSGYDRMLSLFRKVYESGMQLAWMAHFSTPQEVLNPLALAAIRRLQAHHVVLRSQSPIMKHVSLFANPSGEGIDIERSARNWIDLGNILGALGIGFHSIYCARPTGQHSYFTAPLADVHRVFDQVYRSLASIHRPSRHLSMTTSAGKISILGKTQVGDDEAFALKFTEGREMGWLDPVFLAKYDRETNDVARLKPHRGSRFFFEEQQDQIEAELAEQLKRRS